MNNTIRTLSLFSGGGGLDIGFENAGFNILFATDFNYECCKTLEMNAGKTLNPDLIVEEHDITTMNLSVLPSDIDMIIGGPPCQSFSASGRRAGGAAGKLDKRGNLFKSYCDVVSKVKPKAFLFENVRGILGTNKGQDFQDIVVAFKSLGYEIDYRILDAEDYGVSQQRERMFIVGHKPGIKFLFPRPVYGPDSKDKRPYITVREAISNIPFTEKDRLETVFDGGKYAELLPLVPPGENYLHFTAKRGYPEPIFAYRSRFSDFLYKANPDAPVKTLIASPGKYTGPFHWDNRYLTVSEYKRIQGFPDEHTFYGDRTDQIRQIGNSVCPKIAYYLALAIREQIFGIQSDIDYLKMDETLSFDKRKGQKAQKTREIHQAVMVQNKIKADYSFKLNSFEAYVTPSSIMKNTNMTVSTNENHVEIKVRCDVSRKIEAVLFLVVYDGVNRDREIDIKLTLYGSGEQDIQTMWNAVDLWVKKSSSFKSIIELYGHFTEPHPIFEIVKFENRTKSPAFAFAEHCMNFNNCSVYFPKEHLLTLWKDSFGTDTFIELAKKLRSYRFDVRCHETNIAIPQGVYMVAYPFALPYDKQMNFYVREEKNEMAKKKENSRPADLDAKIRKELDEAYEQAETYFVTKKDDIPPFVIEKLETRFIDALELMAKNCEKASGGYSNLVTSLSIKAVYGDKVDVRYHQVQIQNKTKRPAGFNFRGVSENVIYEWMEEHEFHGAKSGWQTRTFERPKPYLLTYDENIGTIKEPFLICYDEVETKEQSARVALVFLIWRRLQLREASKVELAVPRIQDVIQITHLFETHFFHKYKDSKGGSRLPVLALYSIYTVLLEELGRFDGKKLKPLESHSAADSQTGAVGDIEIVNHDGTVFEAIEVKYELVITKAMVDSAKQKIRGSQVDRYYILTTHTQHEPSKEVLDEVENVKKLLGCQMIVNGVIPSIKYYLRLLKSPGAVLPVYADVLAKDGAIGFEHRDIWNKIATGIITK